MLSERINYDEKRNFIRMKVDTMVTFTKIDGKERYEGRCRNLSGAGMLLETKKKLEMGERLRILIPAEGPGYAPLEAMVEVVRVTPEPDLHLYRSGVTIRQIYN